MIRKSLCTILISIMLISVFPSVSFADKDYEKRYDDMESYDYHNLGFDSDNYCSFGGHSKEVEPSDDVACSGEKSLKLYNRRHRNSTLKFLDIFKRELTKDDVGKTFRLSFMLYPDKNSGVYKKGVSDIEESERKNYLYTEEELKDSNGTEFSITMAGPNEKNYKHRTGISSLTCDVYAQWNKWNQISVYYTVKEEYLPTGSKEELSDPYINSFRLGQDSINYGLNQGLCHTFYVDDFTVEEVGSKTEFSMTDGVVSVRNTFFDVSEDYVRTLIMEYDKDNKLIGSFVSEKSSVKDAGGNYVPLKCKYQRKQSDSSLYTITYGKDYSSPVSSLMSVYDRPEKMEYIDEVKGIKRAREMLSLSSATYTDALTEGLDTDNAYFFSTDDTEYKSSSDKDLSTKGTMDVNEKSSAYLKFDISDYKYNSTSHAYIRLYTSSMKAPGEIRIYATDDTRGEAEIRFSSAPEEKEQVSSKYTDGELVEYWFDVSSYVNDEMENGKKSISVVIKTDDANVSFVTKEKILGSNKPCLIFEGVGMKEGEKKLSSYDTSNFINVMKRDITPTDTFYSTPTRTVKSLKDYTPVKTAPRVNKYGGWLDGGKYNGTGFYRTELIDGRWWIIDPEGYKTIHIALAEVAPKQLTEYETNGFKEKYGTEENWANKLPDELRAYGFNGCGPWSDYHKLLPMAKGDTVPLAQVGFKTSFLTTRENMLCVFDPEFETTADKRAKSWVAPYADSPYIMGWYTDNEPIANDDMLVSYLTSDPDSENVYNYYTAWEWLKERHGQNVTVSDVTQKDKNDWVEFVYDRYMKVCTDAIRKYDKNHMIFGPKMDKAHQGAFRGLKNWSDVIGYDYYSTWTGDMPQIDQWYRWAGKPMVNAEWYVKGQDACNDVTDLTNEAGVGWEVMTQDERGHYYQGFVLNMIESKVFVGWQWFKYMDNDPAYGKNHFSNVNANKGIITRDYKNWDTFLSHMKEININTYSLIEYFDKR